MATQATQIKSENTSDPASPSHQQPQPSVPVEQQQAPSVGVLPPVRPEPTRTTTDEYAPDLSAAGRVLGEDEHALIPKLGKVRCYWSLLTSDLEFLYLDPVLQHHMGPQHHSMLGTSLFSYLHPEELEQAKNDLKGIVDSGTLFGSVTRVRFARLPRIREILGCQDPEVSPDAELIIADDHYLALDLVLNAAGEGLILAFFHAIVDKNEDQDRDEKKKSEWTNWCGTPFITTDMVKLLWDQVDTVPRPPQPSGPAFPPSRVFQVLMASPEHEVLLSHPPPREPDADRSVAKCDGGYVEEEFQKLLLEISLNPQGGSQFAEAKTTCTRRFRAKHTLLTEGCYRTIESVFIPYGTLIFACFQTVSQSWLPPSAGRPSVGLSLPAPPYIDPALSSMHHQPQQQMPSSFPQAPMHPGGWTNGAPPGLGPPQHQTGPYPGWQGHPPPPNPYNHHPPAAGYAPAPPHAYAHPPTAPMTDGYTHDRFESTSPTGSQSDSPPARKRKTPDPFAPSVPLVRPKKTQRGGSGGGSLSASGVPKDPSQLRNGGKPPKGVKECQSCGLKDSPEWRKGESGEKDLCNACGLRYARLVAKQHGKVRSRKKKGKAGDEASAEESGSAPPGEDGGPSKKKKAKKETKPLPSDLNTTPAKHSGASGSSNNGAPGSASQQRSPPHPHAPPPPPQHHLQHQAPPGLRSPPRHPHPSAYANGGGPSAGYPPHTYSPAPPLHHHHQQQQHHHQQPPPQDYYAKNSNAPTYHPRNSAPPGPPQGYLPPQQQHHQQQQQQQQPMYASSNSGNGGYGGSGSYPSPTGSYLPSYGGSEQNNGGYYASQPPPQHQQQQQHGAPYQQQQQPYYGAGGPVGGYPGPGSGQGPRGGEYEQNGDGRRE